MTEATAPLLALVGAGWALLGLAALAGLAELGLIKPPSLDRRPPWASIYTTATGRRGPGTPPAPVATSSKEATR
jgi:hypothetical protein